MKIAYVSSAFLADCDMPLLREIHALGHDVTFFLLMSPSSNRATIIDVPKLKDKGGVFSAQEYPSLTHLEAYLPLERIYVVNIPQAHDWAPSSLRAVRSLVSHIKDGHFDVVHLTSPLRYGCFSLYAFKENMVMTMHDPLPHSSDEGWTNRFHRRVAFRMVKNFIVLSQSLRDEFVRTYHLEEKNVYTTGLSIYDPLLRVAPTPMTLPEKYILFVGSINPHKGIKYLCEAMERLKSHTDLSLVIAGRGAFDFDIEAYASHLPIRLINRFVTDGELVSLIRGAVCMVCPYVDATQSGVVLSSFALSRPVVATQVGALPEMFTNGRHGLLVPPCDSEALAHAICHMMEPGVAQEMCENISIDFAQGKRSWQNIAQQTIDIYKKVAEG